MPAADHRPTLGYRPALDGLRALALIVIFWHHTLVGLKPSFGGSVQGGFVGVDLFFVLSGFLITTLMLERRQRAAGKIELRDFYRRRALRLLPALLLFLGVSVAITLFNQGNLRLEIKTAVAAMTYTTNYVLAMGGYLSLDKVHLWTLAVEEQFYVLWPFAMMVLARLRPRRAQLLLVLAIVGVAIWRWQLARWAGGGNQSIYMRTDARADALLVGALLSFTLWGGWRPTSRMATIVGVVGLGAWTLLFFRPTALGFSMYSGGFTVVAILTAGMIVGGLVRGGAVERFLSLRPLVEVGRLSYGLYLWHVPAFVLALELVSMDSPRRFAVAYALTIAFAVASYALVERPFMAGASFRSLFRKPVPVTPSRPLVAEDRRVPAPRARRPIVAVLGASLAFVLAGSTVGAMAQRATERRGGTPEVASFEADPGAPHGTVAPEVTTTTLGAAPADGDGGPEPAGTDAIGGTDAEPATPVTEPDASPALPVVVTELLLSAPQVDVLTQRVELVARLLDEDGGPLVGRTVEFSVDALGEALRCVGPTDAAGWARCEVQLAGAVVPTDLDLDVAARYAGADGLAAASALWPA